MKGHRAHVCVVSFAATVLAAAGPLHATIVIGPQQQVSQSSARVVMENHIAGVGDATLGFYHVWIEWDYETLTSRILCASSRGDHLDPPVEISRTDTQELDEDAVVATEAGTPRLYVIWNRRPASSDMVRLLISTSEDGRSWSEPVELADGLRRGSYDVASSPGGHAFVAYDDRGGRVWLRRSDDFAATFCDPQRLDASPNSKFPYARVRADENDNVVSAWVEIDNNFDIQALEVASSTDGGATFAPPVTVATNVDGVWRIGLMTDGLGTFYVSWQRFDRVSGSAEAWFASSSDGYQTPQRIDHAPSGITSSQYRIIPGRPGQVVATFHRLERRGVIGWIGFVAMNESNDYGLTWKATDTQVSTTDDENQDTAVPAMAAEASGRLFLVWSRHYYDHTGDNVIEGRVREADGTWSDILRVGGEVYWHNAFGPEIATQPTGHAAVNWTEGYRNFFPPPPARLFYTTIEDDQGR